MTIDRSRLALLLVLAASACGACTTGGGQPTGAGSAPPSTAYVDGPATPDGIGKYFMGREISQVMGHLGAGWLERDTREQEERTDLLLDFLLEMDADVAADIGVGTGYFALPWAARMPEGRVLGVDIQPEMLAILRDRAQRSGIGNIEPVMGSVDDPNLPPAAVDVVLIVDAYHEFSHPREMLAGIARGLKPGGRLVLVEYRGEDPLVPIKELHKMTEAQAILEVEAAGLEWVETADFLPQQHVLIFRKTVAG